MSDRFDAAAYALERSSGASGQELTAPLLHVLPVDGAAISRLGSFLGSETVAASDATSARLDELQIDLGEGPCWDAMATAQPVLAPDVAAHDPAEWPAFSKALMHEGVGAIFAFPLVIGPLRIGAIDLYSARPQTLSEPETASAMRLAAIISRTVLRNSIEALSDDERLLAGNRFSRRAIHQATGMVIAQLGISADDAHLLIQGRAFAENVSMREVADSILDGRLNFSNTQNGIGESS